MDMDRFLLFNDKNEMADFMLGKWEKLLGAYAAKKGEVFTAALSGGRTPVDFYRKLAGLKGVPWERVHLFQVDERFVPPGHPESNYGMIRDVLLSKLPPGAGNMHYIATGEGLSSPEAAAREYERGMQEFFRLGEGEFPSFDLILLGIGEDGHTASLFPETPVLEEKRRLAAALIRPAPATSRVTLTLPVLNNGKNVIFMATGTEKAAILKAVIEGANPMLPASLVKPRGDLLYLADLEAGSLMCARK